MSTDAFFEKGKLWHREAVHVRKILLDCALDEELKWGKPCYTHGGDNIVILQRMRDFLALMFFKGALLSDPKGLLKAQGKNTRSAKRMCFTSVAEVKKSDKAIRSFVRKAIQVEKKGLKVDKPKIVLAEELQAALDDDPKLKKAFQSLTPGRQREYNLHISGAKQSTTRTRRVEKHVAKILAGKGMRE